MEVVFIFLSKLLLVFGFSSLEDYDSIDIFLLVFRLLVVVAIILVVFVLFVAAKQCVYNFKIKNSYEYKVKKMLSEIANGNMKEGG